MVIGLPSSAARNAAPSAALRITPPVTLNWRARKSRSRSCHRRRRRERPLPRSRRRCGSSGATKSTATEIRRRNAVVDVALQVGGQHDQPVVASPAAAAGRRPRCWRSGRARRCTSERLPNSASASSKNSTRSPAAGRVEDALEVLLGLADVLADHARTGRPCTGRGPARRRPPRRPASCRCRTARRTAPPRRSTGSAGNPHSPYTVRRRRYRATSSRSWPASARRAAPGRPSRAAAGCARRARRGGRRPAAARPPATGAGVRRRRRRDQPQLLAGQPVRRVRSTPERAPPVLRRRPRRRARAPRATAGRAAPPAAAPRPRRAPRCRCGAGLDRVARGRGSSGAGELEQHDAARRPSPRGRPPPTAARDLRRPASRAAGAGRQRGAPPRSRLSAVGAVHQQQRRRRCRRPRPRPCAGAGAGRARAGPGRARRRPATAQTTPRRHPAHPHRPRPGVVHGDQLGPRSGEPGADRRRPGRPEQPREQRRG